ncbi:MAG: hypothetical protein K0R30_2116 [Ornithinibacter sp.]|nr:hypothetical protein [Ornithinibacter sp.]
MIDFRYHIVSIVSIFMALAVGIVLGAGPLEGELGDTLNKEVAGLRQDKADLNSQLERAAAGTEAQDSYIGVTSPPVLAGLLQDRRVALVVLPGSDGSVAEASVASLEVAGAEVVSTTSVADDWVSGDDGTIEAREAVVQGAATSAGVDITDSGAVSPRDVLLASLLTAPAVDGTDTPAATASREALDALAGADLLEVDTEGYQPADLVVVVAGVVTDGDLEAQRAAAEHWVDLIIALDERSAGTVVAGEATTAGEGVSVLESVRNDGTATQGVTTVDNAGGALGQGSVVHGLVEQATGEVGQYGLAPGAEAPYAPLPTP